MSIYKKLLEIQRQVNGLKKDSKSFGYEFVSGTKVLSEIKPIMNAQGILLKQEVLSCNNQRIDYATKNGSKSEMFSSVAMRFTWIDAETGEKDENLFHANGQNDWEKGLGSALTYAERYFLLKFFHIATDEDDIDNPERSKTPAIQQTTPTPQPKAKAELNPHHEKWQGAIASLAQGKTTIETIRKAYALTDENATKLAELAANKQP